MIYANSALDKVRRHQSGLWQLFRAGNVGSLFGKLYGPGQAVSVLIVALGPK